MKFQAFAALLVLYAHVGDCATVFAAASAQQKQPTAVAMAGVEGIACSDDEWEIVQAGETYKVNQCSDLEPKSILGCKGVPTTSAVTTTIDQKAEGVDDVKIVATSLHSISKLVSLGYSKDHAELALAAADGDVNDAALRLLCTSKLFSSYDRELVMYVLAEQGGDVECALAVLCRMSELAQVYQEDNLNQTIPNATSKMELAVAELGLQFEKAGDIVISSTINAAGRAKQSVSGVFQRAFPGLQLARGMAR